MNIGEQIKKYRNQLGKTQADLAHAIGCYPQTVSYWENGRKVYVDELNNIANGLGITVNELLDLPGTVIIEKEKDLSQYSISELLDEVIRRLS